MRSPFIDWTNRRNNLEIQGITSTVGDEVLEDKVIKVFECLNILLAKSDIEDCHRLANQTPKIQLFDLPKEEIAMPVLVKNGTCGILIR